MVGRFGDSAIRFPSPFVSLAIFNVASRSDPCTLLSKRESGIGHDETNLIVSIVRYMERSPETLFYQFRRQSGEATRMSCARANEMPAKGGVKRERYSSTRTTERRHFSFNDPISVDPLKRRK